MGEKPPHHPVFDWIHERFRPAGEDSIATPEEKERMEKLERELEQMLKKENSKPRADRFLPFLVVRSVLSDNGTRPLSVPFWDSPDIWTAPGNPSVAPDIPSSAGGTVVAGEPTTLYAHVWNLGLAPIVGARVEFYWFDPTFAFTTANANLIGTTSVDLPPRTSLHCHTLVKCRTPWTPTFVNGGHECLIVRVSSIGDSIGPNEWEAWANRHVAQRNISVTEVEADVTLMMMSLEKSRGGLRIQLLQIGAEAAGLPVELLSPKLRIDRNVHTLVLAELDADGRLSIPLVRAGAAGLPDDAKAQRFAQNLDTALETRRVAPSALLSLQPEERKGSTQRPGKSEDWTVVAHGATLLDLVRYDALLSPPVLKKLGKPLPPPKKGHAQVLRLVAYEGDRLVGGYTVVVTKDLDRKK